MRIDTSAHLIYGMQIDARYSDDVEEALHDKTVGVTAVNIGSCDHGKTYLVTADYSADLGKPEDIDLSSAYADGDPTSRWDSMLDHGVETLKLTPLSEPGWILIASQSRAA